MVRRCITFNNRLTIFFMIIIYQLNCDMLRLVRSALNLYYTIKTKIGTVQIKSKKLGPGPAKTEFKDSVLKSQTWTFPYPTKRTLVNVLKRNKQKKMKKNTHPHFQDPFRSYKIKKINMIRVCFCYNSYD